MTRRDGTTYCTCDTPVMDVSQDAGCRRCGLPVDFSPADPMTARNPNGGTMTDTTTQPAATCGCEASCCEGAHRMGACPNTPEGHFTMDYVGAVCDACAARIADDNGADYLHPTPALFGAYPAPAIAANSGRYADRHGVTIHVGDTVAQGPDGRTGRVLLLEHGGTVYVDGLGTWGDARALEPERVAVIRSSSPVVWYDSADARDRRASLTLWPNGDLTASHRDEPGDVWGPPMTLARGLSLESAAAVAIDRDLFHATAETPRDRKLSAEVTAAAADRAGLEAAAAYRAHVR